MYENHGPFFIPDETRRVSTQNMANLQLSRNFSIGSEGDRSICRVSQRFSTIINNRMFNIIYPVIEINLNRCRSLLLTVATLVRIEFIYYFDK